MIHRCTLLAAVLLAACGSETGGDAARGAAPDSAGAAAVAAPAARALVLAPDGLGVTGGAVPRHLAFGSPRAEVQGEVQALAGVPTEQGLQEECPAGPLYQASYPGGLQLVFQDSAFVGWYVASGSAYRTAAGIGTESTLAQLRAAYPNTTVEETSLGMEFAAGEMFGVVTDSTAAGTVEAMLAGINCVFR